MDAANEGDRSTGTAVNFTSDGNGNYIYTLSIPVGNDNVIQANGDITVTLRADGLVPPTYTVSADQSATATIENDDTHIASFTASDYGAHEGDTLRFVVRLNEKVPNNTSTLVYYEILDTSTATAGLDFIQPSLSYVQFRGYNPSSATIPDPDNPGQTLPNPNHVAEGNYTGNIQQIIEIPVVDDDFHELDSESVIIQLTRATGSTAISDTNHTATGTINNNDSTRLIVEATAALEGDSGLTEVPVTVRIAARTVDEFPVSSTEDITFTWATSLVSGISNVVDDTAQQADFVSVTSGTGKIPAGQLSGTIKVQIATDDVSEGNETFTVTIDNWLPGNDISVFGGDNRAKITIKDDDRPVLSIAGGSPVEEDTGANATFTITSTEMPSGGTLTVNYTPVSANFIANSGTPVTPATPLNFTSTVNGITAPLNIPLIDDDDSENNEYLVVTLDEGTGYTVGIGDTATARVHISDDDATIPELSIAGPGTPLFESDSAVFTITANSDPERIMDVYYTPSESGSDFLAADIDGVTQIASSLDFTGDDQTATITIPIEDDAVYENTAEITVTLVAQAVGVRKAYTLDSNPSATATIQDDNVPLFAIWPGPRVIEGGNTHAEFTVRTNISPNAVVPVRVSIDRKFFGAATGRTGMVTFPLDFRADTDSNNFQISPPKTEVTFAIRMNPVGSTIAPFTNGEFEVTLLPDDETTIRYALRPAPRNVATVSVIDGDSLPMLTIAPKANEISEDADLAVFTVTAAGDNLEGKTLSVQYQPAEVGSGDFLRDDQKAGTDPLSVDLTFTADADGDFKQEITVQLDDDSEHEATGEIEVVLHGPASSTAENQSYVVGTPGSATITINDDDAPVLSIANGDPVTEGTDASAVFPITANPSPNRVVIVQYKVEQPDPGYDFVAVTDTTAPQFEWPTARLDFTGGKTTANLEVALITDNRVEDDGVVRVTLVNPVEVIVTIGPDNSPNNVAVPHSYPPYKVSETSGEEDGDVMVMDDDDAPLLTISAPANPVV